MTYDKEIDKAVDQARLAGLTTNDIVYPLLNMAASALANTVVNHNLDAESELEVARHQLDELYVRYLDAYRRRKAAGL